MIVHISFDHSPPWKCVLKSLSPFGTEVNIELQHVIVVTLVVHWLEIGLDSKGPSPSDLNMAAVFFPPLSFSIFLSL